ncbi:MAG: tryptophan synthase subunit alpha [Nitriliruptorales bacterium]|nr:tryptophan synthase subunit alpha [Nitriliruptorales bacterium]
MSADRVTAAFRSADAEGRAALVIYLPAGFPDLATSLACLVAAAEAGADVIEVGFPFSDPMMDGPTIQAANQLALDQGFTVDDDFEVCRQLTDRVEVPCLPMTYVTIADARGYPAFAKDCRAAGLDGVILPDLPASEATPWVEAARAQDLATVFLASSVSTDERLAGIGEVATGFVYAAGLLGVTGVKDVAQDDTQILVGRVRQHTDVPVAVGIGVKTPADAARVAGYADGVIVGSAVVNAVADGPPESAPERVRATVAALREGVAQGT